MSFLQTTIAALDANQATIQFPVLQGPGGGANAPNVPQHSPSSSLPTFKATFLGAAPDSSEDFLQIQGSDTKAIMVTRIEVTALPGAASPASVALALERHSASFTAGGGGTLQPITPVPYNPGTTPVGDMSIKVAATTAATPGAGALLLDAKLLYFPGAAGAPQSVVWEFGTRGQQLLILAGTGDFVTLAFTDPFTAPADMLITIEYVQVG